MPEQSRRSEGAGPTTPTAAQGTSVAATTPVTTPGSSLKARALPTAESANPNRHLATHWLLATRTSTNTAIAGSTVFAETLPRAPESARSARRLVSSALSTWGLESATEAAQLVVSELVANAFVHASGPRVLVTVTRQDRVSVRVAVTDDEKTTPRHRSSDDQAESGRGLTLVAAHCDGRWGVDVLERGKSVWAIVSVGDHTTPR
ncbi:ATP-binding protein [Streptomyces sp. NPDC059076]|uniref:ATP-binding protein n=1 Tax=unclassified Streptomyces TaxID=2593676 RepID=UPI0036A4E333